MKRIALVNQRYGAEVNGGSEQYTRLIAERLAAFYEVDVITTTALDYTTWENYYPPGESQLDGVRILRFPVEHPRAKDFDQYNGDYLARMGAGERDLSREAVWFEKQGPYAPGAIDYLREHKDDYEAILFVTYLYYLTVAGLPEVADKAILIPTAHEEPFIHFATYERLFQLPRAFVFLTDEERMLVQKLFHNEHIPYDVMGTGVDIPGEPNAWHLYNEYGVTDPYLVYVGRIDEGKDCPRMFQYFLEYKKRRPDTKLKLVLMGKAVCDIPQHPDIMPLGFVSDEEKFHVMCGAKALVLPSKFESLSMAVLESMALSVPVIVNGRCDVLRGHCTKSDAGLYYYNYFEFEGIVDYLFSHQKVYEQMQKNARRYIDEHYRWDVIIDRFRKVIETL